MNTNPTINNRIRKRQPQPQSQQQQQPNQQQYQQQQPNQQQYQQQQPNQQQYQQQVPYLGTDEEEKKKKKKRKKLSLLALLLLLLLLLSFSCSRFIGTGDLPIPGIAFDKNGELGDLTSKTKEELLAALNNKVAEGMVNISMNTNPVFETGKSKGTLKITNSASNRYPQLVEIYTNADNTLVYSGGIEVGHKIETSNLLVDLPKGEYDCVAYFTAVNPETNEKIGTAGANIKITIQN